MMNVCQKRVLHDLLKLPQPVHQVQCQYVWIDGSLRNLRTKSKTWPEEPKHVQELPVMEFCGSATEFDVGNEADYYSQPVKIYKDPFRTGSNRLIYCETRTREGLPTFANNRHRLLSVMDKSKSEITEFTFYQSYTLMRQDLKPLTYKEDAFNPDSKSGFFCGRELAESHYKACLYAGVNISSLEYISNQGQWKYALGPSSSVELGDDVWMSRFILTRLAEDFGVVISFDSSYDWSCLLPLTTSIEFTTDHLLQPDRQRIIDNLFSKFSNKDNSLKVVTPPNKIILKGISSHIDPYSVLTRIIEIITH